MGYMCPECQAGKCQNCDGIGYVDDNITYPCVCAEDDHKMDVEDEA